MHVITNCDIWFWAMILDHLQGDMFFQSETWSSRYISVTQIESYWMTEWFTMHVITNCDIWFWHIEWEWAMILDHLQGDMFCQSETWSSRYISVTQIESYWMTEWFTIRERPVTWGASGVWIHVKHVFFISSEGCSFSSKASLYIHMYIYKGLLGKFKG